MSINEVFNLQLTLNLDKMYEKVFETFDARLTELSAKIIKTALSKCAGHMEKEARPVIRALVQDIPQSGKIFNVTIKNVN